VSGSVVKSVSPFLQRHHQCGRQTELRADAKNKLWQHRYHASGTSKHSWFLSPSRCCCSGRRMQWGLRTLRQPCGNVRKAGMGSGCPLLSSPRRSLLAPDSARGDLATAPGAIRQRRLRRSNPDRTSPPHPMMALERISQVPLTLATTSRTWPHQCRWGGPMRLLMVAQA
jgi:hypothetical protein